MKIGVSLFGDINSENIGITVFGVPKGFKPDAALIKAELDRGEKYSAEVFRGRYPGGEYCRFIAGIRDGVATGGPLTALIKNEPFSSGETLRPSSGDYGAYLRCGGFDADDRIPPRATLAAYAVAGAIFKPMLAERGIIVTSHIYSIGRVVDKPFNCATMGYEQLEQMKNERLPLFDPDAADYIRRHAQEYAATGDTLGGVIEVIVTGLSGGEDGLKSAYGASLFGLPGIVGIEFGDGFAAAKSSGVKQNDLLVCTGSRIRPNSNHYGGFDGEYANAMPVTLRAAVAPDPFVAHRQATVNKKTLQSDFCEGDRVECAPLLAIAAIEGAAAAATASVVF